MPKEKKVRLCIDFQSADGLAAFIGNLKEAGGLPAGTGAFKVESLDFIAKHGGVGRANTYVLIPEGEAQTGRERLKVCKEFEV